MMKIGIIYFAIKGYARFWNEFYPTCECYFCTDVSKEYEVFTDSTKLQSMELSHVTWHPVKDRGILLNMLTQFESVYKLALLLKKKYDYLFCIASNYKFLEPILSCEILPNKNDNYLTVLSFDIYKELKDLPYDRNPDCQAYIPPGTGDRYYQSEFYGGRTHEIVTLSEWCAKKMTDDLNQKIIAKKYAESYLNRYLLENQPCIINEIYGKPDLSIDINFFKAVLLDENLYLNAEEQKNKNTFIDNSISFLLDNDFRINPIGIVDFQNRLGNQMFQYAFCLYLRKQMEDKRTIYLNSAGGEELKKVFSINDSEFISTTLQDSIKKADVRYKDRIKEFKNSYLQKLKNSTAPISEYWGFWQCFSYVESNATTIRKTFTFDYYRLNIQSQFYFREINACPCSVSIHIRRGDYQDLANKVVYGTVCTIEYYEQAIKKIKELLSEEPLFYIFTDNPEWVHNNFQLKNSYLVDCNHGEDDWQDMALMSACQHHIIANSSFSWWGAWLSQNPTKKVIAPDWWYFGVTTPDLLPQTWIRIPTHTPDFQHIIMSHIALNKLYSEENPMIKILIFSMVLFRSAQLSKNKEYTQIAEKYMDYLLNNLGQTLSIRDLSDISKGTLYLLKENFMTGNSAVFIDIDAYFEEAIYPYQSTEKVDIDDLIDIISYFVARITYLNITKKRGQKKMVKILNSLIDTLFVFKELLSESNLHYLMMLLCVMDSQHLLQDKIGYLFSYSLSRVKKEYTPLNLFSQCKEFDFIFYPSFFYRKGICHYLDCIYESS